MSEVVKGRLQELIQNIQSCTTVKGVEELEKLYNTKKSELGDMLTPMMDIMVRDAIEGKKEEFANLEAEGKEIEAQKKADGEAAKAAEKEEAVAKKLDEDIVAYAYNDAIDGKVSLTENCINRFAITFVPATIPSKLDEFYIEKLTALAESMDALPMAFSSDIVDDYYSPFSIDEKAEYLPGVKASRSVFTTIQELTRKPCEIIILAPTGYLRESELACRFARINGASPTLVEIATPPELANAGTRMRAMVFEGDFSRFKDLVPSTATPQHYWDILEANYEDYMGDYDESI